MADEGSVCSRLWRDVADALGCRDQVLSARQAFGRAGGRNSSTHPDVRRWVTATDTALHKLVIDIPESMEIAMWPDALRSKCYVEASRDLPPEFGGPDIDLDSREGPPGVMWRDRWLLPADGVGVAQHASGIAFNVDRMSGGWAIEAIGDERAGRRVQSFGGTGTAAIERAVTVLEAQLRRLLRPLDK